jgi:serine/threonine-protein kinase
VDERVSPSIGGHLVPWSAAALCAVLAAVALWQAVHQQDAAQPQVARFVVTPVAGTSFDTRAPALALAPDGSKIAWSACDAGGCRLYVRALDRLAGEPLAGTDGAAAPFFSPDGRSLGFFAGGKLKRIALGGGAPVPLADVSQPLGAVWRNDGTIIFAGSAAAGLMRVSDAGGTPSAFTTPRHRDGEVYHAWPALTPGGQLLFTAASTPGAGAAGRIAVLDFASGTRPPAWRLLLGGATMPRAVSADALVFAHGSELQAASFDPVRSAVTGVPQTIVAAVHAPDGAAHFDVSSSGSLAYAEPVAGRPDEEGLFWWTPSGSTPVAGAVRHVRAPVLAADGRRIAWASHSGDARSEIWIGDLERGTTTRLTFDGLSVSPAWAPDGRTIHFASRTTGPFGRARIDVEDRRGSPPISGDAHTFPAAVSSGSGLAIVRHDPQNRADIWLASAADPSAAARPLVQSPFDDVAPAFSPDGRLMAYQSDESGRWDVYVSRIQDRRRIVVSSDGGRAPFWSPDGRTLYYQAGDRLMSAGVGAELEVSRPAVVGRLPGAAVIGLAPDGRFLVERRQAAAASRAILTLHWVRELQKLLGPPAAALPR